MSNSDRTSHLTLSRREDITNARRAERGIRRKIENAIGGGGERGSTEATTARTEAASTPTRRRFERAIHAIMQIRDAQRRESISTRGSGARSLAPPIELRSRVRPRREFRTRERERETDLAGSERRDHGRTGRLIRDSTSVRFRALARLSLYKASLPILMMATYR